MRRRSVLFRYWCAGFRRRWEHGISTINIGYIYSESARCIQTLKNNKPAIVAKETSILFVVEACRQGAAGDDPVAASTTSNNNNNNNNHPLISTITHHHQRVASRRSVPALLPSTIQVMLKVTGYGIDELTVEETFWRDTQPFLVTHGYELRPRFRPGWIPSWTGTDANPLSREDSYFNLVRSKNYFHLKFCLID